MRAIRKNIYWLVAIAVGMAMATPTAADITKTYYSGQYGRWITSVIATGDYHKVANRTGVGNQLWAAKSGGLDLVYNDGTNWQAFPVNTNNYTDIVHDGSGTGTSQMLAARPGSLDLIWDWNGTWTTTQLSTNTYVKLTAAGAEPGFFYGLRDSGNLDLIWYNRWGPFGWNIDTKTNGDYTAITRDRVLADYRCYAAKAGGGVDTIWYDGSWHVAAVGNLNQVYNALTTDTASGGAFWGAGPSGLDWVWYNIYAGYQWVAYPQSSAVYSDLATDMQGLPGVIFNRIFAARVDGGIDQAMYANNWNVSAINMSIDGFAGRAWSSIATDALDGGIIYGALAALPLQVFDSPNRPDFIKQGTGITVDGDLNDWAGAEWVPLDQPYAGPDSLSDPIDIQEAYYAAKWDPDTNKVYVAVKVKDAYPSFTMTYDNWNTRDAVEIYIKTDGTDGNYPYDQSPAQQYTIGFRPDDPPTLWSAIGYGDFVPDDALFEFAGTQHPYSVQGKWLHYEVAMTPFKFFGGAIGASSIISQLKSGDIIGVDVVAAGHNGTRFTGMRSENMMPSKSTDYTKIALHQLISPLSVNAADGDLVSTSDCVVTGKCSGLFYMESPDRSRGIRVAKPNYQVELGRYASVTGFMATDSKTGERYIDATYGLASDTTVPGDVKPLGMTNKSLGGSAVTGGAGATTIGLLVRTTGRVSESSVSTFKLNDGSGSVVTVLTSGSTPANGKCVAVTGISTSQKTGSSVNRKLLATEWSEIAP